MRPNLALTLAAFLTAAIAAEAQTAAEPALIGPDRANFVQTSAAGDHFRAMPDAKFVAGSGSGVVVSVDTAARLQTVEGIGSALTESSAYVVAHLPPAGRARVLDLCFGPAGADFTMSRTHIGACDFCVKGHYSYDDTPGDTALAHFTIAPDLTYFDDVPGPGYALLPFIKDALARQPALKIVSSPWTAPAWMKDNKAWHQPGIKGGRLLPEYYATFGRYVAKYLEAYRAAGVPVWAVTPENEPLGNNGQWESMEFSAAEMRDYIKLGLGPALRDAGLSGVHILNYDQNRDDNAMAFTSAVLGDPAAAQFVWGTALHWYSTTNSARTDVIDQVRAASPGKPVLHTEGCVDALNLPQNTQDGRFLGWKNDSWWWSDDAADWGFKWASPAEKPDHPIYAPVHRYARDIIDGLNHGFVGWIDWNVVLDKHGGPNHVGNLAAAPVMVDTDNGEVYLTPVYYTLAHFSRYIRPGDSIVRATTTAPGLGDDDFRATAALSPDGRTLAVVAFNRSSHAVTYALEIGQRHAQIEIPANALQSLRIDLGRL
jgi:glucosylceramidase